MRIGQNTVFERAASFECSNRATMGGVARKTIAMLLTALISALICMRFVESLSSLADEIVIFGYLISPILTFVLSMIMSFNPNAAKTLAIPYAILEGVSIGSLAGLLTALLGALGGMIIGLALVITLSFFLGSAVLYCTGIVKVGLGLRKFAFSALFGLCISSLMIWIMGIFNNDIYSFFYGDNNISLIIAIVYVIIAVVYSLISLDNAKKLVDSGLDQVYEWYAAFGIVLNVIWLFWEVLRLILILISRSEK